MEAAAHLEKVGDEESDEPVELGDDGITMNSHLDEFSEDEKSQKIGGSRSDFRGNPYLNMIH